MTEAEYHLTRVKEAIDTDECFRFVPDSLQCLECNAAALPPSIHALTEAKLINGYIVVLDCSRYTEPIAVIKESIDAFLPDAPSFTVENYLVWLFGDHPVVMKEQPTHPARQALQTAARLPPWIDRFIYDEQHAICQPDPQRVQRNLQATQEDVRWYLGTYFPRSYAELFCITDNIFERMTAVDRIPKIPQMSILDVGCGSGGALLGVLWAIRKHCYDLRKLDIVGVDGNSSALDTLKTILDRMRNQNHWNPDIDLCACQQELKASFSTEPLKQKRFDVILTAKCLGELEPAIEDPYKKFLETYLPVLAENGLLIMLDVPTKTTTETQFNPNRMLTAANAVVRASNGEFKTVLPLPCAANGSQCRDGCYLTKTFTVRTSRNQTIETDVCYTVIARKVMADALLALGKAAIPSVQHMQCPQQQGNSINQTDHDPFCL